MSSKRFPRSTAPLLVLLLAPPAAGQEHRTPRAGEAISAIVLGMRIDVEPRDRGRVLALSASASPIPDGPDEGSFNPTGGLYILHEGRGGPRLRAVLAGLFNEVRWNPRPSSNGLGAVLTLETLTLPYARSEYVEGARVAGEELEWHRVSAGLGLAYRRPLHARRTDNALELSLAYEPGAYAFRRGGETSPSFRVPQSTYEGRLHLRLRADAMERNLVELPHAGVSAGSDILLGHRARWAEPDEKAWLAASAYAVWAGGLPFPASERQRLLASLHAGIGSDLDRFSAFRLGGGSLYGDAESLSRLVLPAAATDEVFTSRFAILSAEYRYEALFFLYLHLRGTLAVVERARFESPTDLTRVVDRVDRLPSVTLAATSGFLWSSVIELAVTRAFELERGGGVVSGSGAGRERRPGRTAILVSASKTF